MILQTHMEVSDLSGGRVPVFLSQHGSHHPWCVHNDMTALNPPGGGAHREYIGRHEGAFFGRLTRSQNFLTSIGGGT